MSDGTEARPGNFAACVQFAVSDVYPLATFGEAQAVLTALRRYMAEAGVTVAEDTPNAGS